MATMAAVCVRNWFDSCGRQSQRESFWGNIASVIFCICLSSRDSIDRTGVMPRGRLAKQTCKESEAGSMPRLQGCQVEPGRLIQLHWRVVAETLETVASNEESIRACQIAAHQLVAGRETLKPRGE